MVNKVILSRSEQVYAEKMAGIHLQYLVDLSRITIDPNSIALINSLFAKLESAYCAGWQGKADYQEGKNRDHNHCAEKN